MLAVHGHRVRNGTSVAAPRPLLLFQSSLGPGLRSPKHIQLNLDWLSLTTDTARTSDLTVCSFSLFCLFWSVCFHSVAFVHRLQLRLLSWISYHQTHKQAPHSLFISLSTIRHRGRRLELIYVAFTELAVITLEEMKRSSYSTGWIHVT